MPRSPQELRAGEPSTYCLQIQGTHLLQIPSYSCSNKCRGLCATPTGAESLPGTPIMKSFIRSGNHCPVFCYMDYSGRSIQQLQNIPPTDPFIPPCCPANPDVALQPFEVELPSWGNEEKIPRVTVVKRSVADSWETHGLFICIPPVSVSASEI